MENGETVCMTCLEWLQVTSSHLSSLAHCSLVHDSLVPFLFKKKNILIKYRKAFFVYINHYLLFKFFTWPVSEHMKSLKDHCNWWKWEKQNKKNRLVHIGHASWAECELCSNYETGTFTSRLALSSYIDCMHLTVCLVLGGELMTLWLCLDVAARLSRLRFARYIELPCLLLPWPESPRLQLPWPHLYTYVVSCRPSLYLSDFFYGRRCNTILGNDTPTPHVSIALW